MKKAKILALVLVVSLIVTGAAYALWNQNITLTTYAEMGEMDVELTCDNHIYPLSYMPGIDNLWIFTWEGIQDYMNPLEGTVLSGNQSIEVNVGNLYPGAKYGVSFTIKNSGDVPFKLEGANFTCTENAALFSHLKGSFKFWYQKADGTRTLVNVDEGYLTTGGLGAAIVDACKDITVYPGDQIIGFWNDQDEVGTTMQVFVDDTISGDDFENQLTSFKIDFNWQQCQPRYLGETAS